MRVLTTILWVAALYAQAPVTCPPAALSETQVVELLKGHVPEGRIVQIVGACHIGFFPSGQILDRLQNAGAVAPVLEALRLDGRARMTLAQARQELAGLESNLQELSKSADAGRSHALEQLAADYRREREKTAQVSPQDMFEKDADYQARVAKAKAALAETDRNHEAAKAQSVAGYAAGLARRSQPLKAQIETLSQQAYPMEEAQLDFKSYDANHDRLIAMVNGEEYWFTVPNDRAKELHGRWATARAARLVTEDASRTRYLTDSAATGRYPGVPRAVEEEIEQREAIYRVGLDVSAPTLISKVEPEYSEEALEAKHQGTVLLYIQVDPSGKAVNIRVLHSLGLGLDEKAMEAVKKWKFKPGYKDGKPVTVEAQIEVTFGLFDKEEVERREAAAPAEPERERARSVGEFVAIRAGEFMMGSNSGSSDEKPRHPVRITKAFEMGKYEVTQAQWEAVMGADPSHFKGAERPVENVSWNDVQEYQKRRNGLTDGYHYRLPTEAEWEYVARAGSAVDEVKNLGAVAWYDGNSGNETHQVGQKQPKALGLYDMLGNVSEWCKDWYQDWYAVNNYVSGPADDPQVGPVAGTSRVVRGGPWLYGARDARPSYRFRFNPSYGNALTGFRLVREVSLP